jgi:hypothetical protein
MANENLDTNEKDAVEDRSTSKKPYQEPAFRHEKVFETMALSCGKIQSFQFSCHFNRKNS